MMTRGVSLFRLPVVAFAIFVTGIFPGLKSDAAATPPANDAFANRTIIPAEGGEYPTDNLLATAEAGEPRHGGIGDGHSLWWSWTAPVNGDLVLDTVGMTTTIVAIYRGSALSNLTQAVVGRGWWSVRMSQIKAGETFQIAVDSTNNTPNYFILRVWHLPGPPNDDFASRTRIEGLPVTTPGSSLWLATREPGEPTHPGGARGQSVWWTWTSPYTGKIVVRETNSIPYPAIAFYTGTNLTSLSLVAGGRIGYEGVFPVDVVNGQTYQIMGDTTTSDGGNIALRLAVAIPPVNDSFTDRIVLNGTDLTIQGDNSLADMELGEPRHTSVATGKSVWWSWTAPSSGELSLSTRDSDSLTETTVYIGSNLSQLQRVGESTNRLAVPFRLRVSAGTTYQIAADSINGNFGRFILRLIFVPQPPNDNFANRTVLSGNAFSGIFNLIGATREVGEPVIGGGNTAGQSIWWSWTAPANGLLRLGTVSQDHYVPMALGVFTGTNVSQLTRRVDGEHWVALSVAQGTTYQFVIDPKVSLTRVERAFFEVDFSAAPVNDNFVNRTALFANRWTATNDTDGATRESGEPTHHAAGAGASVWYSWTAPTNGWASLRAFSGVFAPVMVVYRGTSVGSLTRVVNSTNESEILAVGGAKAEWDAQAGITYQIAVDGRITAFGPWTGRGLVELDFRLTTLRLLSPTNGFRVKEGMPLEFAVNTPLEAIDGVLQSVSYEVEEYYDLFRPITFSTNPPFSITVTNNSLGVLRLVARGTNGAGEVSVSKPVTIRGVPFNDAFADRPYLVEYEGTTTSRVTGATSQPGEPSHAGLAASASVWWSWQAPGTGPVTWRTDSAPSSSVLAVYTGTNLNALTPVATQADPSGKRFNAIAGTRYQMVLNSPEAAALTHTVPVTLFWDLNSLSLVSPSNQAVFAQGQAIPLAISTTERSGDIQQVEYRSGSHPVASILVSPFSYTWTNGTPGTHSLIACASTRLGYAVKSDPRTIIIRPANDAFAARSRLEGDSISVQTWLDGATLESGEPDHGERRPTRSIWCTWTAPESGRVWLDSEGSEIIPVIAVYTGNSLGALTLIAANAWWGGPPTRRLEINAVAGTTYQIALASSQEGAVALKIRVLRPAANDMFANRTVVTGTNLWLRSHSVEASREAGEPELPSGCGYSLSSLWWSWTAPSDGSFTIDTRDNPGNCIRVGVFTGNILSNLTLVASESDIAHVEVSSGETYQIVLDTSGDEIENLIGHMSFRPPPVNDLFRNRIPVRGWAFEIGGELMGARREPGEPPHLEWWFGPRSIWFTWTAPASGQVRVTPTSGFPVVSVYLGDTISSLTTVPISWNPQRFDVQGGVTYQFALGGSLSAQALLEVWSPTGQPPPAQLDVVQLASDRLRLRVAGVNGRTVELQTSPDLTNWVELISGSGWPFFEHEVEVNSEENRRFFRARATNP